MSLPESKLLNLGKGYAKQRIQRAVNQAIAKLLKKAAQWVLKVLGPSLLVWLVILTLLFAVIPGSVFNFTSATVQDVKQDAALQARYQEVSQSTVDGAVLKDDPSANLYKVPWGIFAAIDKVLNNCEKPAPETYANALKPIFNMKDSTITIVTTVTDTAGGYSQSTQKVPTSLIDTVDTYKGTYTHHYVWSTTTTSSSKTETRGAPDGGAATTVVVTTTVETTKEVLSNIQEPTPLDYSRFLNALTSFGISLEIDQEMVYELAKLYAGEDVDTTEPVDELMGFSGIGPFSGGTPPPASWIPYFKAAAEKYHGSTDVGEFEAMLMAICFNESRFSDSHSVVSSVGALGPMQFMPTTFQYYGVGQLGYSPDDIWVPEKAIMTSALMLSTDGASNGSIGGIRSAATRYSGGSVAYADLVISEMYYYGTLTGWQSAGAGTVNPGDPSTKGFYWPLPGFSQITDPFGPRVNPVTHQSGIHEGMDIAGNLLTPIIAAKDGVVEEVSYNDPAYGYHIYIRHDDQVETFYGHMQTIMKDIVPGAKVKAGQVIALVGSRGWSTGPHLHFGVRYNGVFVNPLLFVKQP